MYDVSHFHRLPALTFECTQWSDDFKRGLKLASMVFKHWSANIGRVILASSVSYTYMFSYVRRGLQTSSLHTSIWRRQTYHGNIARGEHTLDNQHLKYLPASFIAYTLWRSNVACNNIDRGLDKTMQMSIPYKKKCMTRSFYITTY